MSWSAAQYVKFEEERTRPVRDLVQRIPLYAPRTLRTLAAVPGNSTEVVRNVIPRRGSSASNSSPNMIEAARKRLPDIAFEVAEIRRMALKASRST